VSVLRKEKTPLTTADIANPQPAGAMRDDVVTDETDIDPADRRPPRSAAATSGAAPSSTEYEDAVAEDDRNDTYDGEIVNSSVDSAPAATNVDSPAPSSTSSSGTRQSANQTSPSGRESAAPQTTAASQANGRHDSPLFDDAELRDFRERWDQVQTSFVDEPRHAVEQADTLVATVVKRIAEQFSEERAKLEKQWDRGDNVSTEDLRQGFKRYRAFFDRLLAF
jgi:hypothetical protein